MSAVSSVLASAGAVVVRSDQYSTAAARHFWALVHETPYFAQLVMSVMADRLRRRGGTT